MYMRNFPILHNIFIRMFATFENFSIELRILALSAKHNLDLFDALT